MAKYGSDKPDLRFGLEIVDVSEQAKQTTFKVFLDVIANGGFVRAINAKGAADKISNTDLKPGGRMATFVADYGAKGLAYLKVEGDKLVSSIEKFIPPAVQAELKKALNAENGDVLLFVADKESVVCDALGALRTHLAGVLKLYDPAKPDFKVAWVVDFPSFMHDPEENRWVANHHPFTAPRDEDLHLLESDPGKVRAKAC